MFPMQTVAAAVCKFNVGRKKSYLKIHSILKLTATAVKRCISLQSHYKWLVT